MQEQLTKVLVQLKSKQDTIKTVGLSILGIILIILLINTQIISKREEEYLRQMREFKQKAEVATVYADSLKIEVNKHDSASAVAERQAARSAEQARRSRLQTGKLEQELDSLKEVITDSVEMARRVIPIQDSIISQQKVTIQRQDERILFLGVALEEKNAALIISNQRGDSLQRVITNIPEPPKPSPLPTISRKQAFAGGVALGILAKTFLFP